MIRVAIKHYIIFILQSILNLYLNYNIKLHCMQISLQALSDTYINTRGWIMT